MENRLCNWGLSMYGGYYVNLWAADGSYRWESHHFDSYRELKDFAKNRGFLLERSRRDDN